MAARMAVATGKGLSDLIREEFGLRITFFTMCVLTLADLGNIFAEFAGIASGMGMFGVSKYFAVPLGALLVWLVIVKGSYKPVERTLIIFALIYFAYPVSAFFAHPDWHDALKHTLIPEVLPDPGYVPMIVALIGTTITPWMQFYLQASMVEKGVTRKEYRIARWDVIGGCIVTDVIAFFIVVACAATLYHSGHGELTDAADAATALQPFAGRFAALLFGVGLVNASLLSAAILPLATAYNVCEGLGFESGVDRRFSEARVFYSLYTALIALGAGCVLIPGMPLLRLILLSQIANGVLIPFELVFMLILVNRKDLMGGMHNRMWANLVAGGMSVAMIVLSTVMLWNLLRAR
jgi:Mn2+/Fe2+ NRAMP family transporter